MNINTLIIIFTCIYSYASFQNRELYEKSILYPYNMQNNVKSYYRFITSGFIHANWMHLFFNMFTLYFFGGIIASILGPIHYLLFYILAIILSEIPTFYKHKNNPKYASLGASGAVAAVVFAYIFIDPWAELRILFAIPIPAIVFAILYLWYSFKMSREGGDNINHDAHIYGSIFGFIYMLLFIDPTFGLSFINKLKSITLFQ